MAAAAGSSDSLREAPGTLCSCRPAVDKLRAILLERTPCSSKEKSLPLLVNLHVIHGNKNSNSSNNKTPRLSGPREGLQALRVVQTNNQRRQERGPQSQSTAQAHIRVAWMACLILRQLDRGMRPLVSTGGPAAAATPSNDPDGGRPTPTPAPGDRPWAVEVPSLADSPPGLSTGAPTPTGQGNNGRRGGKVRVCARNKGEEESSERYHPSTWEEKEMEEEWSKTGRGQRAHPPPA